MWPFTSAPKSTTYQVGMISANIIYKYNNEIRTDIHEVYGYLKTVDGIVKKVSALKSFSHLLQNSTDFGFMQLSNERFIPRENVIQIKVSHFPFEIVLTK